MRRYEYDPERRRQKYKLKRQSDIDAVNDFLDATAAEQTYSLIEGMKQLHECLEHGYSAAEVSGIRTNLEFLVEEIIFTRDDIPNYYKKEKRYARK